MYQSDGPDRCAKQISFMNEAKDDLIAAKQKHIQRNSHYKSSQFSHQLSEE